MKKKEYKVVSSSSPSGLTLMVNNHIQDGWTPVGGHTVVVDQITNRYSGSQHMSSHYISEYSQTLIKE